MRRGFVYANNDRSSQMFWAALVVLIDYRRYALRQRSNHDRLWAQRHHQLG
jgi:hypothetical protein